MVCATIINRVPRTNNSFLFIVWNYQCIVSVGVNFSFPTKRESFMYQKFLVYEVYSLPLNSQSLAPLTQLHNIIVNINLFGRFIFSHNSVCLAICECGFFIIQRTDPYVAIIPQDHRGSTGEVEKMSFAPLHQRWWNLNKSAFLELQQNISNGKYQ